ncbi:MAG: L-aspartate oxidase [Nitrospirota bacterium]|nr:L-aspartate oxidase [Nitrospirota bacterium]
MRVESTDFLVIGGGVAGLSAAITAAAGGSVLVAGKGQGCSPLAQGGVAVALTDDDTESLHLADTLSAGKGECDPAAVRVMVDEGPQRIAELVRWGARFDIGSDGRFALSREAAHSRRRILRAGGDATGRELVRTLGGHVAALPGVRCLDDHFVTDLLCLPDGRVAGALLVPRMGGEPFAVAARAVILAAGGAGQIYARTTNPATATGDGIAMGARAGAALRHMEFVQFHPTMLASPYPPFLLSEAVRGEGAVLVNAGGEAFMSRYHPQADLAPRDDVSRAIWTEMAATGATHVFLDMRGISRAGLKTHFPTITATCAKLGIDVATGLVPVAPAAHFLMGGLATDAWGRSTLPGLLAVGEVACSGVHGANRLASNSLLEALVFGTRAGKAAVTDVAPVPSVERVRELAGVCCAGPSQAAPVPPGAAGLHALRVQLGERMWNNVGLLRNARGLLDTLAWLGARREELAPAPADPGVTECRNLLDVADAVTRAALLRRESVGAHFRTDGVETERAAAAAG